METKDQKILKEMRQVIESVILFNNLVYSGSSAELDIYSIRYKLKPCKVLHYTEIKHLLLLKEKNIIFFIDEKGEVIFHNFK